MRWPVGSFLQSCWACLEKVTSLWTETFFQSIDCKDTQEWSQLCFCNKHDRNCWKLVERGLHLKPEYQVSLFKTAFLFICSLIKEFILEKFPRLYPCIFSWANIKENEVITRYCLKLRCKFVKEIACFLQGGQFNDEIGTSNHYIWATSEMIKKNCDVTKIIQTLYVCNQQFWLELELRVALDHWTSALESYA